MYQQYFGFTREPFSADIETASLFQSTGFKELQIRFEHICTYRGIMLLTGAPGTGKTTALRFLLSTLNRKMYMPVYLPLSTVSVFEFYRQLNTVLGGEECYYKSDIYSSIQRQILDLQSAKNILPVIIFDEAHLLKEQNFRELQIIVNFKMDTCMPAVFILSGQASLLKRMESHALESFSQRISLGFALAGLTESEIPEYIAHHLRIAGGNERIIEQKACSVVFQISRGMPRVIGSLIRKSLLLVASNGGRVVTADDVLLASKEVLR